MNLESIYSFLTRAALALKLPNVDENSIALPNVDFDPTGKSLWFALDANPGATFRTVETGTIAPVEASIVIAVSSGEGADFAHRIASALFDAFSPTNARRFWGFRDVERIAGGAARKITTVSVEGASITPGGFFDGFYKIAVKINLEITEDTL